MEPENKDTAKNVVNVSIDSDPIDRLTDIVTTLAETVQANTDARAAEVAAAEEEAQTRVAAANDGELRTPSAEQENDEPVISVPDRFRDLGYDTPSRADVDAAKRNGVPYTELRESTFRSNVELAMQVYGGMPHLSRGALEIEPPADLKRVFQDLVFGDPKRIPWVADEKGNPIRAMDTQETGFGLELIGTQFVRNLWEAARNNDSILDRVRTISMTDPTTTIPIDGDLPEMLFVGESTTSGSSAYGTSKTGSNNVSLSAKKFTIQQIWSGELNEDSIIPFVPFLRDKMNMSAGLYLGSAYYNGDETNAGTGNINLDDADPDDTKHYLAWDGIRHYVLVDATGQGKDMGGVAFDPIELVRARGKLNGGDDDVDNLIKNINWGTRAQDLLAVMDWDTLMNLIELDVVQTVDKYGANATLVTGELGRIFGIPVISPSYASKTEADGKASGTEGNNTLGQIMIFNPMGFLGGVRRDTQLFFDRIQRTDQFLFELYTRRAFTRFGGNVAAGIFNIAVA